MKPTHFVATADVSNISNRYQFVQCNHYHRSRIFSVFIHYPSERCIISLGAASTLGTCYAAVLAIYVSL